jgi:glycosyltransferase involved in cell wall biosynthesis
MTRSGRSANASAEPSTRRARPPAPGAVRLSVVVPAFREADAIAAAVARIRHELADVHGSGGLEVVVVDDGSSDGTAAAARAGGADQVIAFGANRGKGGAVRAGMLASTGRTVAFTDADLAYAPAQIASMLVEVEAGFDVVVGNRCHPDTTTVVAPGRLREVGSRVIHLVTRSVLTGSFADTQCGLKAFRSDVARLVFGHGIIDGFAFDVEVLHLVERYRLSYLEVPVEVENSTASTVRIVADAARLLADLARIRRAEDRGRYDLTTAEQRSLEPATEGRSSASAAARGADNER